MARFLADGRIELCGRRDRRAGNCAAIELSLKKSNQFLLSQSKRTRSSGCPPRRYSSGQPRLVAYLVTGATWESGAGRPQSQVRQFMRKMLPTYMVPTSVVLLEHLPRTFAGKLDRDALPPSMDTESLRRRISGPPQRGVEERLCPSVV